ncbi:MAG: hypothetical protein GX554_02270 [Elusimicrobia bacterium]|nr:hypothetical protein [Elusimicrobiota bacterium]
MGGYRFTFEFFLNLLGNLRISRNARKFILTVLEHNMDFLSFTNIIWVIVVVSVSSFYTNMGHYPSSSTVLILFYWWFLMFFSAIGISMMDRNIKQDSTKPVSRAGLLIVTYAGIYIRTIITLIVLFIGVSIGMSMANLKIAISQLSLFPGILIVFLFVALLIIVRRFIKIFLWGLLLFPVIQSLISRNIASQKFFEGTYLPKIFVPAAIMLTGLFLIVAFRLDIKKDIA